ncbi:MAG: NAD+ synthase [bacterium]|nr:NAD+ synthase [bacterium]
MKITIAQLNPTIGDTAGNLAKISDALRKAKSDASDLLVLPELFLVGYPPRDLLERDWFIDLAKDALVELMLISTKFPEIGIIVGVPLECSKPTGRALHNSAVLVRDGVVLFTQHKSLLPTYDVFDEARYFESAAEIYKAGGETLVSGIHVCKFKGETLGISICEDAWNDPELWTKREYNIDPIQVLADLGATLLINLSASPYHVGKDAVRFRIVANHAKKHKLPFVFVNQVGANDELIFDGASICVDRFGNPIEIFPPFVEMIHTIDTGMAGKKWDFAGLDDIESAHDAMVLGIRDYFRKTGFKKGLVGLSGGIDSAVVISLAAEALGPENCMGITMPSPYSSGKSAVLSKVLAENLGIKFDDIAITDVFNSMKNSLKDVLEITDPSVVDVTLENIQARIRGTMLMAVSNKFGYLVLATGNQSEMAVGYCTLYGDMCGGLAVLIDVPKVMVYRLAEFINRNGEIIPREIITRPPTAELRPNQTDQDTLPPYEILDSILNMYIDNAMSIEDIISRGFDEKIVRWVVKAVNRNEYKRRQAAPGLKITSKAFGMGRRMPIAAKYDIR